MEDSIEFGIGFLAGRPNVCRIINSYYKDILNQIKLYKKKVNITIFILYDLEYQFSDRSYFYNILPEVYENINQEVFQEFLEAINTDGIPDDYFENNKKNEEGIIFADREVALKHIEPKVWKGTLYASTLGINLNNIHNIPAFYNPPDARGEDTFFNLALKQKAKAKVLKTNSYHFHDTFLKYIDVMDGNYSSKLKKISLKEGNRKKILLYNFRLDKI